MSTKFVHRTRCLCHRPIINTDQYRSVIINVPCRHGRDWKNIESQMSNINLFLPFVGYLLKLLLFCVIYNVATQKICVMGKKCVVSISYWIVWIFSIQCRNCRYYQSGTTLKQYFNDFLSCWHHLISKNIILVLFNTEKYVNSCRLMFIK